MIPQLEKEHPNFFVSYCATIVLHLGLGITQLLDNGRYLNPSLKKVYSIMPIEWWAAISLIAFCFMVVGLYYKFWIWARLGLTLGLFACLARGLLIELGPLSGGGIFVWIPIAVFHIAQLSEPPINPLTAKE